MGEELEFRYRPMRVCPGMTTRSVIDRKALSLRCRTLCVLKNAVNSQTHEKSVLGAEKFDILLRDVTVCRNNRKYKRHFWRIHGLVVAVAGARDRC